MEHRGSSSGFHTFRWRCSAYGHHIAQVLLVHLGQAIDLWDNRKSRRKPNIWYIWDWIYGYVLAKKLLKSRTWLLFLGWHMNPILPSRLLALREWSNLGLATVRVGVGWLEGWCGTLTTPKSVLIEVRSGDLTFLKEGRTKGDMDEPFLSESDTWEQKLGLEVIPELHLTDRASQPIYVLRPS